MLFRQKTTTKPVAVAVRVEPKVFLANERTFLSWMHTAILLALLSTTILTFGSKTAKIGGTAFTCIGVVFMLYSLIVYGRRSRMIRNKHPGPYDDRMGPYILVGFVVPAVLLNLYLAFVKPPF